MMADEKRPFSTLIANYIYFRLGLLGNRLTSPDLESISHVQVMVTNLGLDTGDQTTEITITHQIGQPPLDIRGYLQVYETTGSALAKVLIKYAVHGAKHMPDQDIELDEVWLDGNAAATYLGKFYTYLVIGKWD